MVSVRRFAPEEWRIYRDLRLRALTDSPDAFGSTLDREAARSEADWASRLGQGSISDRDLPLIAEFDDEPLGLSWARIDDLQPDVAHIYQVWIAPTRRRLGAGAALLDTMIAWARSANVRRIVLSVTCGDTPAMHLYSRAGFAPVGEPQPLRPGSTLMSQPMQLDLGSSSTSHRRNER
jgi:ribosomal protein S18 acetylase RimI-like enzyme